MSLLFLSLIKPNLDPTSIMSVKGNKFNEY